MTSCRVWFGVHNTMVYFPSNESVNMHIPSFSKVSEPLQFELEMSNDHMTPSTTINDKWFCFWIAFFFYLSRLQYGLSYAHTLCRSLK